MAERQDGARRSRPGTTRRTRTPDRQATEQALMDSALALIERDGILAGLNMQEVADEADVNRGLIHHYFGSRRALLRAALDRALQRDAAASEALRRQSPFQKGAWHFRDFIEDPRFARLVAMLALDGDDGLEPIPHAHERLEDYERERRDGVFVDDIDTVAALTVWDSAILGYALLRDAAGRQFDVPVETLDRRVLAMLARLWQAVRPESRANLRQ